MIAKPFTTLLEIRQQYREEGSKDDVIEMSPSQLNIFKSLLLRPLDVVECYTYDGIIIKMRK